MWNDFKNLFKALGVLLKHLWESLGNVLVWAINFLSPVVGSVKGVVNPEEFYRVVMVAMSAGGSLYGFIQYLGAHANEFVTDPNIIAALHAFVQHIENKRIPLAIFTVLFVGEYMRRKYHGDKP